MRSWGIAVAALVVCRWSSARAADLVVTSNTTLTADITCTSSPCVEFDADNVTLNGKGHTIDCNGQLIGIQLAARTGDTVQDVTVVNCFEDGIYLYDGSANQVSSVTMSNANCNVCTAFETGTVIKGLSVSGGSFGVDLEATLGATVGTSSFGQTDFAIQLGDSSGCTIQRNSGSDNTLGLLIEGDSDDNTISANTFTLNRNGIVFNDGATANGNLVTRNKLTSNDEAGISVGDGNTGNTLSHNTALSNGVDLADSQPCSNTWTRNRFNTDNELGADAGPKAGCIQ